jgi:hypothetical protein
MARLKLRELTVLITAFYLQLLVVAYGFASFGINWGDISLAGEVSQVPGLPIAMVGVYALFGLGFAVRRTRKRSRLDKWDMLGLGIFNFYPMLTFFVTPIREFVFSHPALGLVFAVPMIAAYVLPIER